MELSGQDKVKRKKGYLFGLFALVCSLTALALLAAAGFGSRLGLWHFRTGFEVLKWGGYAGLASCLVALVAGIFSLKGKRWTGAALSLAALVLGIVAFDLPYSWKMNALEYPRIHDITTDPDNPPKFVAIAPLRGGQVNYGGAAIAAMQMKAYPDIKTVVVNEPAQQVFQAALDTAREMGWQIIAEVPQEGRIEATDPRRAAFAARHPLRFPRGHQRCRHER